MRPVGDRLFVIRCLLVAQLVMALLVAGVAWTVGPVQAVSALLGGLICWLPNCYFAYRAFRHRGARSARRIVRSFYMGESVKMLLTVGLFALVFSKVENLSAPALFAGYLSVLILNGIVPIIVGQLEARDTSL